MKSFFPEKMLGENLTLSLDSVKAKFNFFELQLHELHWQTTVYSEHMALGMAYERLYNDADVIVEKIMGYLGTRTRAVPMETIKDYTPEMPKQVVSDVITFAHHLEKYAEVNNMPDVGDMAVALSGKMARIRYLLTMS